MKLQWRSSSHSGSTNCVQVAVTTVSEHARALAAKAIDDRYFRLTRRHIPAWSRDFADAALEAALPALRPGAASAGEHPRA